MGVIGGSPLKRLAFPVQAVLAILIGNAMHLSTWYL